MNTVYCHSCHKTVRPVRPGPGWKLALAASVIACFALVLGICILGMGLLILSPVVAVLGLSTLGPLAELATRPAHCSNPACGKYLTELPVAQPVQTWKSTPAVTAA